ncbi:MAG: ACT domain-containing protein [Chloroflexi bacterium]|nr:ACT domain-containing protein [Chloroflexota bacterium]
MTKLITMKFGGTSVGSPEAIANVVGIVKGEVEAGSRVMVIVSAMSGVTDALLASVKMAIADNKWGYLDTARKLRDRHDDTLNILIPPGKNREQTQAEIAALLEEYTRICQAVNILGEATPRIWDAVVSFGERLSCRVVAAVLRHHGLDARAFDAGDFLLTDDQYQQAAPLWAETQARIDEKLRPMLERGVTPVITGFLGATRDGNITTLGRGGSDYSGAIFAACADSDELVIWTDVDGVMTADPRLDKRARVLPYVSYQEVGELAFYGAKVLHPKTVQPILDKGIPIRVRNTFNPQHPGTLIRENGERTHTVIKAVTSIKNVSLLTVSGKGMIGVPGIAGRTFLASAQAGASILMISQSSSEQSFCFLVTDNTARNVREAIEAELAAELARRDIDRVDVEENVVIITAVGAGMRGTPGVAGRVFSVMGERGINVIAIAQGSSECSISFVVPQDDLERAVIALHDLALDGAA